ncbi:MAG: hypothetical protein JWO82_3605 [Akkermansiaceae bacterium]|nr:hypothetical protein [Akkermansiaceae bacterium]
MKRLLIPASCIFPLFTPLLAGAAEPQQRGDALQAAVKANDAAKVKGLLQPEDRLVSARFHLSTDPAGVAHPISNLVLDARDAGAETFHAMIDYGVWLEPRVFERAITDLGYIKDHYPDFKTTLGPSCLGRAAETGNEAMLSRFLDAGIKPRAEDLATAVLQNHADAVAMLVKAGASHDGDLTGGENESLKTDEFARRTMKIGVLDALGLGGKDTPVIAEARKAWTPDPAVPLGRWSFATVGLTFDLQDDGTGLMFLKNVGQDWGEPILWTGKTASTSVHYVAVTPVPGYRKEPIFSEFDLAVVSGGLAASTKSGLEPGTLVSMDDQQRRIMEARNAGQKYAGPAGKWRAQVPPNLGEQERALAEKASLEIAADGKVTLDIQVKLTGRMLPGSGADSLSLLLDNGAPAMPVKIKEGGRILVMGPDDGHPEHQGAFVRDESGN